MTDNRIKFSKTAIESLPLPPAGKRLTAYDTIVPKLAVRKTSTGSVSFCVIKRTGSSMTWLKLGAFPDLSVEQARIAAQRVLGQMATGSNPAEARRAYKATPTLNEFFAEFREKHGKKKLSWKDDEQRYRDYLKPSLGSRKLTEITRGMISDVISSADKRGKSTATQRNIRALASIIFAKAVEWGKLESNPVTGIRITGEKVTRDRFLLPHEMSGFFKALAAEPSETARDFVLLALLTGARRANVCAMQWESIDLEEGVWRIGRTKNGDPQNVVLTPEAVAVLKNRQNLPTGKYVFPSSGKTGHYVEPRKGVERVMKRACIPYGRKTTNGVTLHDLRRTLGSWQAKTGSSLLVIGKALNQKSTQATAIYARLDMDPVRQSVHTATNAMLEAGGLIALNAATNDDKRRT